MIRRVMIAKSWVAPIPVKMELALLRPRMYAETNNVPTLKKQTIVAPQIAMEPGLRIAEILYAKMEKRLPAVRLIVKQLRAVPTMGSIQGQVPLTATTRPAPMVASLTIPAVRRVVGLPVPAPAVNAKA